MLPEPAPARRRAPGRSTMAAPAAHSLRMDHPPTGRAGRVRQWLGTVPAARVWAVPQRLPLMVDDGGIQARWFKDAGHERARGTSWRD